MTRTTYSKNQTADGSKIPNKTIVLPFDEATYADLIADKVAYKAILPEQIHAHPELFPTTIFDGWDLHCLTRPSAIVTGAPLPTSDYPRRWRGVADSPSLCDALYDLRHR